MDTHILEDMDSLWSTYPENTEDLKKKILSTALELEAVKSIVTESEQNVNNLLGLLNSVYKERDDARNELQKIYNKMNPCSNIYSTPVEHFPHHAVVPETPIRVPPEATTESNSLSDYLNSQSHNSSPVNSPSYDSILMGLVKQLPAQEHNCTSTNPSSSVLVSGPSKYYFLEIKRLPEKGKLLQSVTGAGPLLQSLFIVDGPLLPRWRNPPTLHNLNLPPILNVSNVPYAPSCNNSRLLNPSSGFDHEIPNAKRCRLI